VIIKELFLQNENEFMVESKDWVPTLWFRFERDPFNWNVIEFALHADVKASLEDVVYLGVFFDDEEKPRIVLESDLPYYWIRKGKADLWDLPFGKHEVTIALRSKQAKPCWHRQIDVYITRFYTLKEMIGVLTPIILGGR